MPTKRDLSTIFILTLLWIGLTSVLYIPETTPPLPSVDVLQLATSLLPSPDDDVALRKNFATLVSRILFGSIDFFMLTFDDVVEWHIKHEFYEQMSRKSDVVSIGV